MTPQKIICKNEYQVEFCLMCGNVIASDEDTDAVEFKSAHKSEAEFHSWNAFLIEKIKLKYPFILTKYTEVSHGDAVVSFGYYFYSNKAGLIEVDEFAYKNKVRRELHSKIEDVEKLSEIISKNWPFE